MRVLAVDIGSTYTKAVAMDTDEGIIARASVPTTTDDVSRGMGCALERIGADGADLTVGCSSAAGGLRLVAIGLVPELTVEAARRAALGAGARVIGAYGFELTAGEIEEIQATKPDMLLLAGGTDGGNRDNIVVNARVLASSEFRCPVVVAGNKSASGEAAAVLADAGFDARVAPNVMPRLYEITVEPVRHAIRELFLERIIIAKGLDRAAKMLDAPLIPTPAAVLNSARLLARDSRPLMVVDVGGATTDVYSIGAGPVGDEVVVRGLAEPDDKRTVEGDLGVRSSAIALVDTAVDRIETIGHPDHVRDWISRVTRDTGLLPVCDWEMAVDRKLAGLAVELAVFRHVGRLEPVRTMRGSVLFQDGKDLRTTIDLIGTGGPFALGGRPGELFADALFDQSQPFVLRPENPRLIVDRGYVMAQSGLLAEHDPEAALRMMQASMVVL